MTTVEAPRREPLSPIRVGPDGRHFVDPAGRPVFWLGDTQWELFRLYDPPGALRILRDRQAKGINVILVMLTGVDSKAAGGADTPPGCVNLQGERPWLEGDGPRPNEKYFQHVDGMIRLGERTGQTLVVGVHHQWHAGLIPAAKARPWARWVARRYRDVPNLIWCMYPKAVPEFTPLCRELAAGLQEGDGGAHLISAHPDPAVASSSFLHEEPWLAFNMIQTCLAYDKIPEAVAADLARAPAKPVVMAEGAYEGQEFHKFQTPHHVRKQAYWSQVAGGYHVYGHNDAWHSPQRIEEWLSAAGAKQICVFREVMTSLPRWWELVPAPSVLASGRGSGFSVNLAARAPDRRWVLVYLSEPSTVSVRMDSLAAGAPRAHWIDPRTGDRTPAGGPQGATDAAAMGESAKGPEGTQFFTSPQGWEDALLLLESGA